MMSECSIIPFMAAAGAVLAVGLAAAAVVAVEEEENEKVLKVAETIEDNLLAHGNQQRLDNQPPMKRHFIYWDRVRARD